MQRSPWKIRAQRRYRDKQLNRGITQLNVRVLSKRKGRLREFSSLLLNKSTTAADAFRQAYPRSWKKLMCQVGCSANGSSIQPDSAQPAPSISTPGPATADITAVTRNAASQRTSVDGNA